MPTRYWLIKSEPSVYAYADLERERKTAWTGVRNFEARNNLRQMAPGDLALFYHSNEGKAVVGVARVVGKPEPDPTAPGQDWASVNVAPHEGFAVPVTLEAMRTDASLKDLALLKRSRLSVSVVTEKQFHRIRELGTPGVSRR
ncbi:MAG: EVE domain-containing protein [Myxococcaceae bacterium]